MSLEELKLYCAGLSRPQVVRQIAKWRQRAVNTITLPVASRRRPGQFLCDKHWEEVKASFSTKTPIDVRSVAIGITTAMYLADLPMTPTPHACCLLNDYGWQGILERSQHTRELAHA